MTEAVFLDNLMIFWFYMMIFFVFIGFAGILEKIFDRFPAVTRFFERLLDVDLSEDDEDDEELEVNRYEYRNVQSSRK